LVTLRCRSWSLGTREISAVLIGAVGPANGW
jgi:hypothetical protein